MYSASLFPVSLFFSLLVMGAGLMAALMLILWLIHLKIKNGGLVAFGWAFGIFLLTLFYCSQGTGWEDRKNTVFLLASLWGLRLALFILFTRVIGYPEDQRFQKLRKKWQGLDIDQKFLEFFELQGFFSLIFSVPFLLACLNPEPEWSGLEKAGIFLWTFAFFGEVISDLQLNRFKSKSGNKEKVCRVGFWNYSRHPNYFFEWLIWVAMALFSLSGPYGAIALFCPIFMLFLLFKMTGIPVTESQALSAQGDDYRKYQKTTSVFVPWFKRK